MKCTFSVIALAASLALVNAQQSAIPECALECFLTAIPEAGCELTDSKCQCTTGQAKITESLAACVPSKCSADEIAKIQPAVAKICAEQGVTLSSIATAASSAASSGTASSASTTGSASVTGVTGTASGTSVPESTGAAAANMAGLGAVAFGLAAVVGL